MHPQDSRQTLSRIFSLALLAAGGLLAPAGCTHQAGGDLAFRRFWGFEPGTRNVAGKSSPGNPSGLIPKLLGHDPDGRDGSQDPFLAQNFGANAATENALLAQSTKPSTDAKTSGTTAQTLFDAPPIQVGEFGDDPASATEGNPFRLVQHQAPVNDVSSTEKRPPASSGNRSQSTHGPSQIDRLKIALSRDANTPAAVRPQGETSEVSRQRVDAMMKNARRQIQLGQYESALRWAIAAEELSRRSELFFGPEEDPPADLVRSLADRLQIPPTSVKHPLPMPEMPIVEAHPQPTPSAPTLSIEFPEADPSAQPNPFENLSPEVVEGPSSLPHSTQAMQQAVIAPETLTQPPEEFGPTVGSFDPASTGSEAGSPMGESARVGVNQGAVVSVEGPLEAPREAPLPPVPLAPPAMERAELPPFEVARSEPAKPTIKMPLLPTTTPTPQTLAPTQPTAPTGFLYAENNPPAPTTLKNVDWDETDEAESGKQREWWMLPACFLAGVLVAGVLLLKRKLG